MIRYLKLSRYFRTRTKYRLFLRGLCLITGLGAGFAFTYWVDDSRDSLAAIAAIVVVVASVFEFLVNDLLAEKSFPRSTERIIERLEGQLGQRAVCHITEKVQRVIDRLNACDRDRISGTVHILVDLNETPEHGPRKGLLQLTDYVGPKGGPKGRVTTLDQGLIGRCARTGAIEWVNFADENEYRRRMVAEFGFTPEEATKHTKIARSYIALPLRMNGDLVGVTYLFSSEPQVFPRSGEYLNWLAEMQDVVGILAAARLNTEDLVL